MIRRLLRPAGLFATLCFSTPAQAAFLDVFWSARVAALGGAYTALSDDAAGIWYNPAALAGTSRRQTSTSYAELFTGLDQVDISFFQLAHAQPLRGKRSLLGIGWGNFTTTRLYKEDTLNLAFAHKLQNVPFDIPLSAGVSFRYLTQAYEQDLRTAQDPVFSQGRRRSNTAVDLHAHTVNPVPAVPGLSLGLSVRAVNTPDVGYLQKERVPREFLLGTAYRWKDMIFPVDVSHRDGETAVRAGAESLFMKERIAIRFGSDLNQAGAGFGYKHSLSKTSALVFDYAFLWPLGLENTSGSHRATLGWTF